MRPRPTAVARCTVRPLSLALHRAQRAALRRPRVVLAVAALLFVAMVVSLSRGRVALSIRETVDADTRTSRWLAEMTSEFGSGNQVLLVFSRAPGAGGRLVREDLAAIRGFVERERARNPEIVGATTPWDARRSARVGGGLRLVPVLDGDDPAGLAALAGTPFGGILTDREGRDAAVELVLRDTPRAGRFGRFDPRPVGALLERARGELTGARPGLEVRLSGSAAFEWYALVAQGSITVLNVVVLALILVSCRVLFGTWRSGLLLTLVIGWGGALVYGGMAAAGMPVDLLSTGLFLMLAVAAIEDFVFVAWERLAHGAKWRRAFRTLLLPGALTSLTTVVGFASLCTADLAIVRRFGLWGAVGASLEWAATFLVLPALLQVAPRLRALTDRSRALSTGHAERLVAAPVPRWAARAALTAVILAGVAATRLDFTDSPAAFFDDDHPFCEAIRYTARTRGWEGDLRVVFPDDASAREVADLSRRIAALPGVAQVLDPGTILATWTGSDPLAALELAADLAPATTAGGLVAPSGRMRAMVFASDTGLATAIRVRDGVLRAVAGTGAFPAGDLVSYADFGEAVPRTLLRSLGTCLLLVGLLVALLYRSAGLGWGGRAMLASAFGPSAALAAVWLSGLHVNFVTAVFASVLVGLTGDNAVQFACAAHGGSLRGAIARRGGAAVLVTVVMALCGLTFLGSAFVPPRKLGMLLSGGLVAAFVGDVWILRGLWGARGGEAR